MKKVRVRIVKKPEVSWFKKDSSNDCLSLRERSAKLTAEHVRNKYKAPPSRIGAAACVSNDCLYLFGGHGAKVMNDLWRLDLSRLIISKLAMEPYM